jgi:uncharacterized membrane protein (UPF0127 family)
LTCLLNTKTKEILVEKLIVRGTFLERFKGLLFYKELKHGSAMLLVGTEKVHTLGMYFPIDLYFFSESMCLIDTTFNVPPWKIPRSPEGTRHVLEIQYHPFTKPLQLCIGDQVSILWI